MTHRERLESIGFKKRGRWIVGSRSLSPTWEGAVPPGDRVLYAFVTTNGDLLYLGKTTRGLQQRISAYCTAGQTKRTKQGVNIELRGLLEAGTNVEILAWVCDGNLSYGGFQLDLAAALEGAIIHDLQPPCNQRA